MSDYRELNRILYKEISKALESYAVKYKYPIPQGLDSEIVNSLMPLFLKTTATQMLTPGLESPKELEFYASEKLFNQLFEQRNNLFFNTFGKDPVNNKTYSHISIFTLQNGRQ